MHASAVGDNHMENTSQFLRDLLALLIGGVITFLVQRWKPYREKTLDYTDRQQAVIEKQGETLGDAFDQIAELAKRITQLEEENHYLRDELRKYINGYSKAILFINAQVREVEIPNFLETDPRMKVKK